MTLSKATRRAFTLLELLLATAIGVLLMGALYVAMMVVLNQVQIGRELIDHSLLVRQLCNRISHDLVPSLPPALPAATSSSSTSVTTQGATAGTGTGAAASTGGTTTTTTSTTSTPSALGIQVQGGTDQLAIFVSRVPREINTAMMNGDLPPIASDIRRITYWLVGGGDAPLGLARQELVMVTTDDGSNALPPDIPEGTYQLMAEEVKSLQFQYWDGSAWQDSWDGTVAGSDGTTPIGPPLAIAVTIGVPAPGAPKRNDGELAALKTYRHVVPLVTANGVAAPSTSDTTATSP